MDGSHRRADAWLFAHKLITLAKAVKAFAGADLIHVPTAELCKAMGRPEGARLEEVQSFARDVAELMQGYGLDTACGCGYLAFTIGPAGVRDQRLAAGEEPTVYAPPDLDEALEAWLAHEPPPEPSASPDRGCAVSSPEETATRSAPPAGSRDDDYEPS